MILTKTKFQTMTFTMTAAPVTTALARPVTHVVDADDDVAAIVVGLLLLAALLLIRLLL